MERRHQPSVSVGPGPPVHTHTTSTPSVGTTAIRLLIGLGPVSGELDVGHRVEAQYVNPDAAARTWYPAIIQKVDTVEGAKSYTVLFIGGCNPVLVETPMLRTHLHSRKSHDTPLPPPIVRLHLLVGYGAVQVVTSDQIRRVQAHGVRVPVPELRPGGNLDFES
jgi:hypothetical protein